MALMLGSLYDALSTAGVPPDKARKAAEEVAEFETRLRRIEGGLAGLKWMLGFGLALNVAILLLLFRELLP